MANVNDQAPWALHLHFPLSCLQFHAQKTETKYLWHLQDALGCGALRGGGKGRMFTCCADNHDKVTGRWHRQMPWWEGEADGKWIPYPEIIPGSRDSWLNTACDVLGLGVKARLPRCPGFLGRTLLYGPLTWQHGSLDGPRCGLSIFSPSELVH